MTSASALQPRRPTRPATNAGTLLRGLVIGGYPIAGILPVFLGVPGSSVTYPFRFLVILVALYCVRVSLQNFKHVRVDLLLVVFLCAYAVRLLYDYLIRDLPDASVATLFYFLAVLVPAWTSMLLAYDLKDDRKLAYIVAILTGTTASLALSAFLLGLSYNPYAEYGVEMNRLWFESVNPISLGHAGATSILAVTFLIMTGGLDFRLKLILYCIAAISVAVLVLANSRGPIVAGMVALTWFMISKSQRLVYITPLLLAVPFVLDFENVYVARMLERFFGEGTNVSNSGRLLAQEAAIHSMLDNPIFGAHYLDPTLGSGFYPHNLILESGMALGGGGLLLFLVLVVRAWAKMLLYFNRRHPFTGMLFVHHFMAGQFSGSLWGADAFMLLLGIVLVSRRVVPQRHPPSGGLKYSTSWHPNTQPEFNRSRVWLHGISR